MHGNYFHLQAQSRNSQKRVEFTQKLCANINLKIEWMKKILKTTDLHFLEVLFVILFPKRLKCSIDTIIIVVAIVGSIKKSIFSVFRRLEL